MLSDYQNRLLDMWEAAMQAGIPADAKGHIEWLLSVEFDVLDGQTSCKNCGRHLRIIGKPHVLGTLCSDKCGHENREHYA